MSREIKKPQNIDIDEAKMEEDLNRYVKLGEVLSVVKDITDDVLFSVYRIRKLEIFNMMLLEKLKQLTNEEGVEEFITNYTTMLSVTDKLRNTESLNQEFIDSMISFAVASGIEEDIVRAIVGDEINYIIG